MMPKLIGIDKRYSAAGVSISTSCFYDHCFFFLFKVTVIGVHSPKYEHEKNKANIRHAMEEESIPFNVVNDNGLQVWKHIGCQLWPTVLIFGPDALPLLIFEGENHVQHTETFLPPILAYYKSSVRASPSGSSVMKNSPEDLVADDTGESMFIEKRKNRKYSIGSKPRKFTYPSHICVTSNGQLCISFAGSNRLILCEIDGKVIVS